MSIVCFVHRGPSSIRIAGGLPQQTGETARSPTETRHREGHQDF